MRKKMPITTGIPSPCSIELPKRSTAVSKFDSCPSVQRAAAQSTFESRVASHPKAQSVVARPEPGKLAEGVGFEPTMPCGIPVFKTGAIDHSATPPSRLF